MKFTQKEKDFALRLRVKYSRRRPLLETPVFVRDQPFSLNLSGFFATGMSMNFDLSSGNVAFTGMYSPPKDAAIFRKYLTLKNKRRGISDNYDFDYSSSHYTTLLDIVLREKEKRKESLLVQEEDLIDRGSIALSSVKINKLLLLKSKRTGIHYSLVPKKEEQIPWSNFRNLIHEQPVVEERKTVSSKIKGFFTDLL